MAPCGLPFVLGLEVATSWRSTDGAAGNTPADPRDEHRKPTVGSAADPWRASQARYRYRSDERSQVDGAGGGLTLAGVEDVPPQARGRHRGDGSVCHAYNLVPPALWIADHGARPATYP